MKIKLTIALLAFFAFGQSQENITYQKPSAEILQLADHERAPSVMMNGNREWMVLTYRDTYKTLDDLNQSEVRLGGLRINPQTNISSTVTYIKNLKVRKLKDTKETQVIGLPANAKISNFSFSPDDTKLAFTNTTANGVELYIVDLATATAKKLTSDRLNANLGNPVSWYRDSKKLLVRLLPENRPALLDDKKDLPTGPIVSTSDGKVSQNRTYQDLLKNPQDEANFVTITTSELYTVDLNGKATKYKDADTYVGSSFSPDGNYLLVTRMKKPFSYIVPYQRFPMVTTVYDLHGKEIKVVNETPLTEIMPKGFSSTTSGKRSMYWSPNDASTLIYVQALDGGDQSKKVEYRDEVFTWKAPFNESPKSFAKTKQRFAGLGFTNSDLALVYDRWYDTRNMKTYLIDTKNGTSKEIADRNYQDVYSDPGDFHTIKNQYGRDVIDIQNGKGILVGEGHTKEGQFPFIEEFDFKTLAKKRLYTSKIKDRKEDFVEILDPKKGELLVTQQSAKDYPNYYIKNYKTGKTSTLTHFENPFKALENVHKEVITYKRNDGVTLTGNLYLPAGYDRKSKKEKLPLLIWAYPAEYKDRETAGQSTKNANTFTYPSYGSFIYWVSKGYAVLDDAAFPIIGEGTTEPNDTFIEQLVANGQAAIDAVDQLGYIDRKRVAVGGHSYGAFMTANLLSHSNIFACGVARSGAYNRTLTPFGFQMEQRNYWDNPNLYNTMSPFMNADKMKTPLLLIHGDADNNPGTFTLQTERYFQALKNLGAPVRMVLLPKESHGYAAKESIMHTLWEQDQFLEKCLKK